MNLDQKSQIMLRFKSLSDLYMLFDTQGKYFYDKFHFITVDAFLPSRKGCSLQFL